MTFLIGPLGLAFIFTLALANVRPTPDKDPGHGYPGARVGRLYEEDRGSGR